MTLEVLTIGSVINMNASLKLKAALFLSGAIAATIGGMILIVPATFYASYGIEVSGNPSALNETRASGGLLFALGILVLSGAFAPALRFTSSLVAILIYTSYGLSRLIGFTLDGWPNTGIIEAAVIEIVVALILCGLVFYDRARRNWRTNQY